MTSATCNMVTSSLRSLLLSHTGDCNSEVPLCYSFRGVAVHRRTVVGIRDALFCLVPRHCTEHTYHACIAHLRYLVFHLHALHVRVCMPTRACSVILAFGTFAISHLAHLSPRSPLRGSGSCRDVSISRGQWPIPPDAPGFQVPPYRILPPQLWYSSRELPLHLHFDHCSDVLGFVSSFDVAKTTQAYSFS